MAKQIFRVSNWHQYNKSLVQRGSINFWFEGDITKFWCHKEPAVKERGGQPIYTDAAIKACLIVRSKYNLTLRETQGFIQSIFDMQGINLKCPNYTIICKRAQVLDIDIDRYLAQGATDVAFDSTGFKIYGEGEWKVRQHGVSKRRTWVKLHLGVDSNTQQILACATTTNSVTDAKVLPQLLSQITQPINIVTADGAYDQRECYKAITRKKAIPVIPPRRDAVISNDPDLVVRDFVLNYINKLGGDEDARKAWKKDSRYHRRSLSETAMFRLKQIFSSQLRSRKLSSQGVELKIRVSMLNKMTANGMPKSYVVPTI